MIFFKLRKRTFNNNICWGTKGWAARTLESRKCAQRKKKLMRKWKVNGIKSSGTSSGRYALHGIKTRMIKREKEEEEWMRSGQRRRRFDGRDDLMTCRGGQGYMDFFSEVFCVVSFFLFSWTIFFFFFAQQKNTKMENFFKEWTTGRTTWCNFAECSEF